MPAADSPRAPPHKTRYHIGCFPLDMPQFVSGFPKMQCSELDTISQVWTDQC